MTHINRNKSEDRINQLRRDTDTVYNIEIGIESIDIAIFNHIKNVINPVIEENNTKRKIPIYFATPKRWRAIQADGWFRDEKTKQLIVPVIIVANKGLAKNPAMAVDKMDGNLRKTIKKGWNKKDRYDIFSTLNESKQTPIYYSVTVPDYVNINYDIQIWTSTLTQMDSIIESFIYAEESYWGDKYNKFRAHYDNINNTVEIDDNKNRAVKNTFTITVNGYIIPKDYDNKNTMIKILSPALIDINMEIVRKISKEDIQERGTIPIIMLPRKKIKIDTELETVFYNIFNPDDV